jgi:uncharacterized protein (TIGR02646 family)
MRRLHRTPLSDKTRIFLRKRANQVAQVADARHTAAEAKRLWDRLDNKAFREVRRTLAAMASGVERCMYCEDSEGTAIEHFWPRAVYPLRAFDWDNYLLACSRCNSNYKRDRFPLDPAGLPLLLNPVEEEPFDHLAFSASTGRYEPLTDKGRSSEEVYGLNRATLTRARSNAWVVLQKLIVVYARAKEEGDLAEAARIEAAVREYPFAGVLAALLHLAAGPGAALVHPASLQALRQNPEIQSWV